MKLPRLSLLSQICITHLISHIHMLVLPVLMPVMLLGNSDIDFIQIGFAVTPTLMLTVSSLYNVQMAFMVSGIVGLVAATILYPKASNEPIKKEKSKAYINKSILAHSTSKLPLITPAIFLMLILFLLLSLSGSSIQNFSVSALVKGYSISLADANIALTAFLLLGAVGVLVGGQLADYSNRHGLIATGALVITALLALFIATFSISSTIIITIIIGLMGFLSGIIAPSRDMLVRNVSPKGAEGRVFGIVSTGFNFGGTIGPILFGWILDQNYPRGIFWCTAIFMALTAIIAFYQEIKGTKRQ